MARRQPLHVVVIVVPEPAVARLALLDSGDLVSYDRKHVASKEQPTSLVRFVPFEGRHENLRRG
jgi:hypothetical protein